MKAEKFLFSLFAYLHKKTGEVVVVFGFFWYRLLWFSGCHYAFRVSKRTTKEKEETVQETSPLFLIAVVKG